MIYYSQVCSVAGREKPLIMKFRVIVEFDGKVASYGAYCPELPGCTSAGDTEEEALNNIKEAIAL